MFKTVVYLLKGDYRRQRCSNMQKRVRTWGVSLQKIAYKLWINFRVNLERFRLSLKHSENLEGTGKAENHLLSSLGESMYKMD